MLARISNPADIYRRIEFDARVSGADQRELVGLLYEELLTALRTALFAHAHGHNQQKSTAITRAITVLNTLELGISPESLGGIGDALLSFYRSGKHVILDSVVAFDPVAIERLHTDFDDVRQSYTQNR